MNAISIFHNSIAKWGLIAVLGFTFSMTSAQNASSHPDLDNHIGRLTKIYSLSSAQVVKIKQVYLDYMDEIQPYQLDRNNGISQTIQQMKQDRDNKVYDLLTDGQRAIYDSRKAKIEEKRKLAEQNAQAIKNKKNRTHE